MINHLDFVVFDVETTGLNPKDGDRIIEIAAVKIKNFEVVDSFDSLVNPARPIPAAAQSVNRITDKMVKSAPSAGEVLPRMIDFIGQGCLVGQNVKFDLDFLCYELSLMGRQLYPETKALDTLKMSRSLLPFLGQYKLATVASYFGVPVNETHRALADVKITARVFEHLLRAARRQGVSQYDDLLKNFGVKLPLFPSIRVLQESLF